MKLPFLHQANSTSPQPKTTVASEYAALFCRHSYTLPPSLISFLFRLLNFSRLLIRFLLYGYRPQIRQSSDREHNRYWYVYYPLSGVSKFLADEAEIQQWLELRQDI